ncbi:MAG: Gldg family protein [Ignavibacteriales bacterium]|nr:Gldg family protein [Ignavibacteriales bacterium]
MSKKQIIFRIVLVLGIVVLINIIGLRFFKRFDLTNGNIYTLSDASKNLVKSLDDKFLVKAYFTSDLPPEYANNRRDLRDLLDEYRAYAGGNFQYEFIDPGKKEEIEQEAQRYGIPPVQVQVLKEDKLQIEKAYMGMVFLYGDKQERVPVIQTTLNLEYEVSSAIKKMTSKELKKIGFLTGQGEATLQQMSRLQEILTKQYQVTPVDVNDGKPIPSDISVLMVVAPSQPFKSWEKFLIDQYLMRGGKIAFLINKINATLQTQYGNPLNVNIDDLLESYGVRINSDLVRDVSCAYVSVQQQAGFMVIQNQITFYYLPRAGEFDKKSPIVKDLSSVVFYFTSSIDTSLIRSKGLASQVLVKTSNKSGRQENVFIISPTMQATREMFSESGIPLTVAVEGAFASAFGNKPIGVDTSFKGTLDTTNRLVTGKVSKIIVVGDGDFVQDQLSGGNRDNFILAGNFIDWLADDIGLAAIRSRESGMKPLDEVSESTKTWLKGLNLALPPIIVVVVGIVRWRWRISMRKKLESRGL